MYIYIIAIEYDSWDNGMIWAIYSTLEKAQEAIKEETVKFGGKIKSCYGNGMKFDVAREDEFGCEDTITFSIKRHEVK